MPEDQLTPELIALRAHDITVCLENSSVPDFDLLSLLGMGVRLALHLRGVQAISYNIVRNVAVYLLAIPPAAVRPVLELLAEAEFVRLDVEGRTIKTVIPDVPFYERIFSDLAQAAGPENLSEPEWLTLQLTQKLASSPIPRDQAYQLGADKALVDRVLAIGSQGSFIIDHRARGRSILLSPTYFPESPDAYVALVAGEGSARVKKILDLLRSNQGWPLALVEKEREITGVSLDDADLAVMRALAGQGFVPPPAIETRHAGVNHFLFGPRPGELRLQPSKRPIYEAAMALVAAVRQGQLLPRMYAIHYPDALLRSLREKGFIRANTEAMEQYRQVATLKIGRLEVQEGSQGWARLVLIDRPENIEAIDLARLMVRGSEPPVASHEDIVLALRKGESYVESLIGRKRILAEHEPIQIDEESKHAIDSFLLRGAQ